VYWRDRHALLGKRIGEVLIQRRGERSLQLRSADGPISLLESLSVSIAMRTARMSPAALPIPKGITMVLSAQAQASTCSEPFRVTQLT
jgi:hypothetical protein